jgi:hypothetical protein
LYTYKRENRSIYKNTRSPQAAEDDISKRNYSKQDIEKKQKAGNEYINNLVQSSKAAKEIYSVFKIP